jgi:hypothetical protein
MELIEQQRLLAQLYTDADSRREPFANTLGVNGADADKLTTQVEFFARSLQRKRLNVVANQLPKTRQAMGKAFDRCFFQYSGKPMTTDNDATGFVRFLQNCVIPTEHRELARFEASRLEAAKRRFLVRRFRLPKARLVIWFRLFPGGPLREWTCLKAPAIRRIFFGRLIRWFSLRLRLRR